MGEETLRIGVVGLAGIGRMHTRLVARHPQTELAGVCDIAGAPRAAAASEHGCPGFPDIESLIGRVSPDAVILATPPATHAPLVRAAAERGVHVLVEKPMAHSLAACREIIDVCRVRGVTLMVGHKKRFVPTIARLKALLEGELGPAQFVICRYPHPGRSEKDWFWNPADGGGPLRENAVHAADTLLWLCGPVDRVQGEADFFTFAERAPVPNCLVATLRFASGAIASLAAGMISARALSFEDLFVATERGVAQVSGPFDNPHTLRWALRSAREAVEERLEADPFRLQLEHFVACIRAGAEPLSSGEVGRQAVALCERWLAARTPSEHASQGSSE